MQGSQLFQMLQLGRNDSWAFSIQQSNDSNGSVHHFESKPYQSAYFCQDTSVAGDTISSNLTVFCLNVVVEITKQSITYINTRVLTDQ